MRVQVPTMSIDEYVDRCFEDRLYCDAQVAVEYAIESYQNLLTGIVSERKTLNFVEGSPQFVFADRAEGAVALMRDFGNQIILDLRMPWPVAMAYVSNLRFLTGWVLDLRAGLFGPQTEGALVAMEAATDNFLKGAAAMAKKAGV